LALLGARDLFLPLLGAVCRAVSLLGVGWRHVARFSENASSGDSWCRASANQRLLRTSCAVRRQLGTQLVPARWSFVCQQNCECFAPTSVKVFDHALRGSAQRLRLIRPHSTVDSPSRSHGRKRSQSAPHGRPCRKKRWPDRMSSCRCGCSVRQERILLASSPLSHSWCSCEHSRVTRVMTPGERGARAGSAPAGASKAAFPLLDRFLPRARRSPSALADRLLGLQRTHEGRAKAVGSPHG
jgi:hypothetical protein